MVWTKDGMRAADEHNFPIASGPVISYLRRAFGSHYTSVLEAMQELAASFTGANELDKAAYGLYTQFRPDVPRTFQGWGAKGRLDLDLIRSLKPK